MYFALSEGAEKAIIVDLTPAGRHGIAFGLYNAALGAGVLTASVTFGYLYDRFGAPVPFTVRAALAGVAAIALLFVLSANIDVLNATNPRHE